MKNQSLLSVLFRFFVLTALVFSLMPSNAAAQSSATLTIDPITWNVIGLDSNDVSIGPNHFPVGARVCNTGASPTTATVTFTWDGGEDTYIRWRPGTSNVVTLSLPAASLPLETGCRDAYFEIEVDRNIGSYGQTRGYTISASDASGTVTTPSPRELFVERLISQSRNSVFTMYLDGAPVPAGGMMNLMVGQTYVITLAANTATNGYEQIESFINFPNTIFQVLSVATTYTADTSSRVTSPDDKLYGDGCQWISNPLSPNYRSCVDTGKAGGDITVAYTVRILSVPGAPLVNPEPLSMLVYDFSGSSYHYNGDYSVQVRFANIVNATVTKTFVPKVITPNGTSTLTFTVTNPGPQAINSVNFQDSLPGGVSVAANQTITYTGCGGSAAPASVTAGQTLISFTGISVAALSTCSFSLTVTSAAATTYTNTTGNLYIGADDTGSFAQDLLVVSTRPPAPATCAAPVTLATFTMPTTGQGSGGPPPPYTTKLADTEVLFATASSSGGTPTIVAGNPTNAWQILGGWNGLANPTWTSTPYFQIAVDSSNYGGIRIAFDYILMGNGDWGAQDNFVYIHSQADANTPTTSTAIAASKGAWTVFDADTVTAGVQPYTAPSSGVGTTTFRINFTGAPSNKPGAYAILDNIVITGCPRPVVPTLTKAFTPVTIAQSGASTLRFTFTNPNSTGLTGVGFADTLPTGLTLNTPSGLTGVTCTAGSISGQTITAAAGSRDVTMSGATLAANASCYFEVSVVGTPGVYTNISNSITSAETGPNTTSGGYGTASLTVVAPPVMAKAFGVNSLLTGNTTTLSFTLSNPNRTIALSNIAFVDSLPAGVDVADGSIAACGGTLTTTNANPATVALNGGSLAAGESCTFSVNVTGSTVGLKENSVTASATGSGVSLTSNTATAELLVRDPVPGLAFSKKIGLSATGPWMDALLAAAGTNVYYQFTVENTGDVTLDSVSITDNTLNVAACNTAFAGALPAAVISNDDHIRTCVIGPVSAISGRAVNTAYASYTYNSVTANTGNDLANYQNGNFGHLPSGYENMNFFNEGGAFHLNGSTYLGASVDTNDPDGTTYEILPNKATDDGVTWTGRWISGYGTATLDVTCPTEPCYVYAWFDWNGDFDFDDADEAANWAVNDGTTDIQFEYPGVSTLPAGTYFLRFRIYDQPPTNPQPNGIAFTGTTPTYGEIEDYAVTMSPTSIELVEVSARPAGATPVSLLAPLALAALIAGSLALGWRLRRR